MTFLDPMAIAAVETLPLRARIIVEGALSGHHRARTRGSSIEFSEHVEYTPGDELRHLDWKVYAKADRHYIKHYEEESELTAHLVLDASASMGYAGEGLSKLAYGAHLAAALAYLLIRQRDRVALRVFGDAAAPRHIPARSRPAHLGAIFALLAEIAAGRGGGEEAPTGALEEVADAAGRRRGLVILISDLFEASGAAAERLGHLRARGHDVVVFHTLDRHELELPFEGLTNFRALEGSRELLVHPETVRRRYKRELQSFLLATRRQCLDRGVAYLPAPTDKPFESALREFLWGRAGGHSGGESWAS